MDSDGRDRVRIDLEPAVKLEYDKLPYGFRKSVLNNILLVFMREYKKKGSRILHAVIDGRFELVEKEMPDGH